MTDRIDTDATVEQIRAFANALNPTIGPGFGQDVVALCDEVDRLRTARELSEEEREVIRQARERFTDKDEMAWGEFLGVRLLRIIDRLSALPDSERPEGETVIDGKRYRVEPTNALQVTVADDGDPLISVREELYRLVPVSPSVDPEEGGRV